ncbi:carbohydrate binding family 9 domain-containing protein [Solitalea sp. MAHUQ-68]|uniref:Carbohydrate binding family 9 domain-containing protein n=1 Tax=Solitalea agri TaxID=2953739 RepID=A0A9X2F1Y9_9SPHI|nr:DUF5916 domain-containing protein [Solitalea agri]MCO4293189.1 carbohydrate binding family 9 domain-containing protein [Solitalea agri]
MKLRLILIAIFCVVLTKGYTQNKTNITRKSYTTQSIGTTPAPVIDGQINDKAWDLVEWTGDYIEYSPEENTAPIEQTKFKVIYDKDYIYFAFRCYDKNPEEIVKRLSRRDGFEGDWLEINISSLHDQLTAFSFAGSVAGVKSDGFISDNGKTWEGNWNPIWYLKTAIDKEGWTAEIKIPLSQLKFSNEPNQVWGLQSTRRYFRTEERSLWQRTPLDAPGWVSEFGELHGLKGLSPHRQTEIQPFLLSKFESYPPQIGNPFKTGKEMDLNGGLDAKIGLSNELTLNMTINPDFGQVEADPAAIALDGFQIYFQERRPFFVENRNIFDYAFASDQDNLFYSRRIGRNPQIYPSTAGNSYVNLPESTSILGAAKVSGKTQNGWSLGILESLTSAEYADVKEVNSKRRSLVEPLTNYFVTRVQKDLNNHNTYIGAVFTATNRKQNEITASSLHSAAYSGGFDFGHNWKNRKYYLKGNAIFSHVLGSKTAITSTQTSIVHLFQRPDAGRFSTDPTRTSLTGSGGNIEIGKASEGNWRYSLSGTWRSPELELNDIGFLRSANDIRQIATLTYSTLKPVGVFRRIDSRVSQLSLFDFQGNYNQLQLSLGTDAVFKNNWNAGVSFIYSPFSYSNAALQGGPRLRYSEEFYKSFFFASDSRKKLRFNGAILNNQGKHKSTSYTEFNTGIGYQPTNAFTFSFTPIYSIYKNKLQYVGQPFYGLQQRYILANMDQQGLSASFRIDYSINPDLTIQYYAQPFISRGRYQQFNRLTNPLESNYANRVSFFNTNQITYNDSEKSYLIDEDGNGTTDYKVNNPDYAFIQFRSNLVIRWEYIPGSEIYAVWSQGITENGNPQTGLTEGLNTQILGNKPLNIFFLKATYRFML